MSGVWYAAFGLLAVLAVANGLLTVALLRQVGVLHQRMRPTGPGTFEGPIPEQRLPVLPFVPVHGRPDEPLFSLPITMLVYVTPGCSVCRALPDLVRAFMRHEVDASLQIAFVTDVPEQAARGYAAVSELPAPLLQSDSYSKAWEIPGSPYVLCVALAGPDEVEVLAAGVVNTLEQLEDLASVARLQRARLASPTAAHELRVVEQEGAVS